MTKLGLMHCIIRREYLQWRMFTHVSPMFHFYPPPRKRQRTVRRPKISLRFQRILEGIEMEHWSRFIWSPFYFSMSCLGVIFLAPLSTIMNSSGSSSIQNTPVSSRRISGASSSIQRVRVTTGQVMKSSAETVNMVRLVFRCKRDELRPSSCCDVLFSSFN